MRQWRILHTESSHGWGGQEMRVYAELEWMRARGHWVGLGSHPSSQIAQRAYRDGIPFYPLRTQKAKLPLAAMEMAGWLRRQRIDVVNTHSSNDGWTGGLAARLAGRILIRSRHIEVDYPNRFLSGIAYRTLPHHVVTTSQRIAQRLMTELRVPASRVTCIATGIDLQRFHPSTPATLRNELGLGPETALVGMVSVLRSWKGHATFLDAAALLLQSGRAVHFVIAGDGPGRQELAQKVSQEPWRNRVTLLAHRPDVEKVLASLDVLVLPSYAHEGIPQIILQAQATGRAVVASNIGGIPEVVTDGVTGMLVAPRDPGALAGKISLLLADAPLRASLGASARQVAEEQYGIDRMGQRLLDLYASLKQQR